MNQKIQKQNSDSGKSLFDKIKQKCKHDKQKEYENNVRLEF